MPFDDDDVTHPFDDEGRDIPFTNDDYSAPFDDPDPLYATSDASTPDQNEWANEEDDSEDDSSSDVFILIEIMLTTIVGAYLTHNVAPEALAVIPITLGLVLLYILIRLWFMSDVSLPRPDW